MYVNRVTTPWGTNASGQTYGVSNQNGTPDLVAVIIDQGKVQGYVKASDLDSASGNYVVHSPAQALAWDAALEEPEHLHPGLRDRREHRHRRSSSTAPAAVMPQPSRSPASRSAARREEAARSGQSYIDKAVAHRSSPDNACLTTTCP